MTNASPWRILLDCPCLLLSKVKRCTTGTVQNPNNHYLYRASSPESHPLYPVEQAGEKQGWSRCIVEPSELESEGDQVWSEQAMAEVEGGVAMADSPNSCMRLWNSSAEKKGTVGATI